MTRRRLGLQVCAAGGALLAIVAGAGRAEAYGVRLRWQPADDVAIATYRAHVRSEPDLAEPPVDVGLPARDADGIFSTVITGLEVRTDYAIAVSGVLEDGRETPPSNVVWIGYAQVAALIDTDGDGVKDAADACPATPAGSIVGPSGCACTELACDDGNPCNGLEHCDAGTCLPGEPIDCSTRECTADAECADADACTTAERCVQGHCTHDSLHCHAPGPCTVAGCDPVAGCTSTPVADGTACVASDPCLPAGVCAAGTCVVPAADVVPMDLHVQRLVVRPLRGRGSSRVTAVATFPGTWRSRFDPRDMVVELWGARATARYQASVSASRFAPGPHRVTFVASAERAVDGLRRLELVDRGGVRTIRLTAIVPETALPRGAASSLTWLLRFGNECARDVALTCGGSGRGMLCGSAS